MKILKLSSKNFEEIIKITTESIREGKIIICPTDTVYGLICDAMNEKAVKKIFKIKKRPKEKPISIFVKDIKMAKEFAKIDKNQEKFLQKKWPGRTIAVSRVKGIFPSGIVCQWGKIGLRMPKYKLLNEILNKFKGPIAQTSANITGKPTPSTTQDIIKQFTLRRGASTELSRMSSGQENQKYQPDLIVDAGNLPKRKPSKVLDLTTSPYKILRE